MNTYITSLSVRQFIEKNTSFYLHIPFPINKDTRTLQREIL